MTPILQALLLAERIYEDKTSGKKIIAGVFHKLCFIPQQELAKEAERQGGVPIPIGGFKTGSPFAYISMTEIHGKQSFVVRFVDLFDDQVRFQIDFEASVPDPREIVEVVLPLPPLPTEKPGVFALELLWKDEPLGSCRVIVEKIEV